MLKKLWCAAVVLMVLPGSAQASIDIGGLIFDDQAFADRIMSTDYTGLYDACPGYEAPDLESAILGADLNTWINYGAHDFFPGEDGDFNSDAPPTQYIEVSFVDNLVLNEDGPDIAIFQLGGPNAVRVSLDLDSILNPGAVTSDELVVTTSSLQITNDCGTQINVGYVDLSDFNLVRGDKVYHLFLSSAVGVYGEICGPPTGYADFGVPEVAAVGALNSDVKLNVAPLVDDLDDTIASLPVADLALRAVARDDGLPALSVLSCQWIVDSGSGPVVFDDANQFETTAHFSVAGRYDLSAEVTDGELITTRSMSIMVTGVDSDPPTVPDGLTGEATSSTRIVLDWNASTDNAAVAEYEIYRDGILAGTTAELFFIDTDLQLLTTYDYYLVAVDLSGNPSTSSGTVQISTLGYVAEVLIGSADDDAEEEADGTMVLGSSDLDLVDNGLVGNQIVGLRFDSVAVPQYAQVLSAWIEFTTDSADLDPASLTVSAEASGDASPFTTDLNNLTARALTSESVSWDNVEQWPAEHYFHRSPDISPVVQELLNRPDWAADNAMALLVGGSGLRRAKAFESGSLVATMLHVEYSVAPPVNQAPVVDAGTNTTVSLPSASLQLTGSVLDDGLPNNTLNSLWVVESGPGLVSFGNRTWADTQATFYKAGVYVLRLSADDGEYPVSDTVVIQVTPEDLAPPSVPRRLVAVPFSGSRIDLSWKPSLDNVAVTGYVVYRDGVPAGTTPGTSFSDTGLLPLTVYQYAVQAYDPSGNTSVLSDVTFAVSLQESYAVSLQVAASTDDSEEGEDGSIQLGSSDLELVDDVGAGNQTVGLRFDGVDVPQGAYVTGAWIEFETDEVQTGPASLLITAEDTGHAATFSSVPFDISSRPTLVAEVDWSDVPPWETVDEHHFTPDLYVLVQDLVDRGDWATGNAMAFIFTGSGVRTAESYEGEQFAAPILHVEYTPGVPVNSAPYVDAGANTAVDLTEVPLQLAGTMFDDGLPYDTLTCAWSQTDGPGTAVFDDMAQLDTGVGFDVPGTYVLQLTADDGEYLSSDTVTVLVTENDFTPPSIPLNLNAMAISGTRIDLTWEASTDNVAVYGYEIYRDGLLMWRTTGTSFSDIEVEHGSFFEYTVVALDTSGNYSDQSEPSSAYTGLNVYTLAVAD